MNEKGSAFNFAEKANVIIKSEELTTQEMSAQQSLSFIGMIPLILAFISLVITIIRVYFWIQKSPRFKKAFWIMWIVTILAFAVFFALMYYVRMQMMTF